MFQRLDLPLPKGPTTYDGYEPELRVGQVMLMLLASKALTVACVLPIQTCGDVDGFAESLKPLPVIVYVAPDVTFIAEPILVLGVLSAGNVTVQAPPVHCDVATYLFWTTTKTL